MSMLRFIGSPGVGEDSGHLWAFSGNSDEPLLSLPAEARGVYYNQYSDLDDSPVSWHITEPVDPTSYYNDYIGSVVGDLY
eukprot:CAMPEP_0172170644 /NCGR_PEP_ID=MMETSP1050-20130122/11392_1 /TAXON_ID=233186 /ORGANISM="Cryptomonas curvata, Strain CCAP979/52" /LENGTH=79 /DNA_ID=CAMNT_0012841869 /DNA_START=164 /DNA_END=403 /DNA_ORIENTATION=-